MQQGPVALWMWHCLSMSADIQVGSGGSTLPWSAFLSFFLSLFLCFFVCLCLFHFVSTFNAWGGQNLHPPSWTRCETLAEHFDFMGETHKAFLGRPTDFSTGVASGHRLGVYGYTPFSDTLWLFNIAMENG